MHSERNGMEGRIGGRISFEGGSRYMEGLLFYQQLVIENQVVLEQPKQRSWLFLRASLRR
jgi:hypothetical protein